MLLLYGMINTGCFLLELSHAPNYRPTFTFKSTASALLAILATGTLMFFIHVYYASIFLCSAFMCSIYAGKYAQPIGWDSIAQVPTAPLSFDTKKFWPDKT